MHQGTCLAPSPVPRILTICSWTSQAPKAAEAWRGALTSKGRPKIAAAIATPADNAELFEEGWEEALAREAAAAVPGQPKSVNGGEAAQALSSQEDEEDDDESE